MSEILGLEHVALRTDGPTLTMSVALGQSMAIVGPAGAGKTLLVRTLAGQERPAQGTVHLRGRAAVAGADAFPRRSKVQLLAKGAGSQAATEVFLATRLWDLRQTPVGELSPAQYAACELVEALVSDAEVVFIDGQLDLVDLWTLKSVMAFMRNQMSAGRTFVVATHRPDLVRQLDALIFVSDRQIRFAGTVEDLLRSGPPHTIDVMTEDAPAVRALVAPFQVRVQPIENGLRMEAPEGQEIAARLLLDGYGDVKYIVTRPPSIEEALQALL